MEGTYTIIETDATRYPRNSIMPERLVPYCDRQKLCTYFKEMMEDLIITLPKDHLKQIKMWLRNNSQSSKDFDRIIMLVHPEIQSKIDIKKIVKELMRDLGVFVITRRCILDRCEKHEDYVPHCSSPELMSEVARQLTLKQIVATAGWIMFDHPCTVREARCLQQDGVLPTVTLVLMNPPGEAEHAKNTRMPARTFFQQDFEGLKYVYKATLKEVHIDKDEEDINNIARRCFSAVRAAASGVGPGRSIHVVGAPGNLQGPAHWARVLGAKNPGSNACEAFWIGVLIVCYGWVMNGYPQNAVDFEHLDNMVTPPNRIIFLNMEMAACKERCLCAAVECCTGKRVNPEHPEIEDELNYYFTEALAGLRAAAGMTAVEISALGTPEEVNTRLVAAVMAAPLTNVESGFKSYLHPSGA